MCVIVFNNNKNKKNKKDDLMKMFNLNSDGIGVWSSLGVAKFMDFDSFYDYFEKINAPYVIHFRLATHGKRDIENIHPFRFGGNFLLFHNGVENSIIEHFKVKALKNNKNFDNSKSDTYYLSKLLNKNNFDKILSNLSSKFLVVNEKNKKIHIYGKFVKKDGIYYSNLNWDFSSIYSNEYKNRKEFGFTYNNYYQYNNYKSDGIFSDTDLYTYKYYGFNTFGECRSCGTENFLRDGICFGCYEGTA